MSPERNLPSRNGRQPEDFVRRWGEAVSEPGFVAVPKLLIEHHAQLGLDLADLGLLIQLLSYWWKAEGAVFPSRTTLARRAGLDDRSISRRVVKLENLGIIEVARSGRKSNHYTFEGLRSKLLHLQMTGARNDEAFEAGALF